MDFTHFFLLMMAGNLLQSYCMILLADTSIILLMYWFMMNLTKLKSYFWHHAFVYWVLK